LESNQKLKINFIKMATEKTAKLNKGVIINAFGPTNTITEKSLTDEIAVFLLDSGRATKEQFATLPKGWKEAEKPEENKPAN